ncbi:MAG: methyltransferase [Pedosphaera sp.]|nr:methyltransferase [Pedosphaera sp.]
MNPIKHLLQTRMGFHAETIGSSAIDRIIRSRMRANGLIEQEKYLKVLQQSSAEWEALVESVVVTETWFFRDMTPFQAMVRLALEEWLPTHPKGLLRLLSVPCSSGEEPYSLSMALLDAGFPSDRFQIDALDISERALACAHKAVYGRNSFRGKELRFRDRHFHATKEGYVLSPSVKNQVRFQKGNLLDADCLAQAGAYDFVFCRNLLIYFDGPTQERTLLKLKQLLNSNGILFMGAAELPAALGAGFTATDLPFSFACRKGESAVNPVKRRRRLIEAPDRAKNTQPTHKGASVAALELELTSRAVRLQKPAADLDKAQLLADAGRLAEAAEVCEAHLREHGVSARAYYLLGVVRHAAGAEMQAMDLYRRALYLDPNHYETLMQWSSLSSKNGDSTHARLLQERAARARKLG